MQRDSDDPTDEARARMCGDESRGSSGNDLDWDAHLLCESVGV